MQMINNKKRCVLGMLFLFGMISIMMITAACGEPIKTPVYDEEIEPVEEVELFGIVTFLDTVNGKITIHTLGRETDHFLEFTKAADVRNQYGDLILMNDVELGSVVNVVYDDNRNKLLSLYLTDHEHVSKVDKVSGAIFDFLENTLRYDGTTYKMADDVRAFSDNVEIEVNEICSEDQLTLWMYNDRICSIYVELGHGYVRLSDYAGYMGGMVEIGYDVIVPVTEDMLLTVREGEYTLRISKDDYVGTKKVEVIKNREVHVSLADLVIQPKEVGSVLFDVKPAGAKVYIDRKRANTEGAIELVYGKHRIDIIADGYITYSGTFTVKEPYKVREYRLKKEGEEEDSSKESSSGKKDSSDKNTDSDSATTTENKSDDATENTTEKTQEKEDDVKDVVNASGKRTANKVILQAPSGVSVYFDGEYLGIVPISFTKVTGSHIITFSQTGYLSKSYTVNFEDDGKDITLSYDELVSLSSLIE